MNDILERLSEQFQLPLENPVLIFSLILFIILLSPIVLKRLRIPGIIGLIISGIIIGPDGFYLLENNEFVDIFSTIGLLYIMFIAGLELDLNQFKAHRNKSLIFGAFTFIIPLAIGFPICYYLLSIGDPNFSFETSLLTASMFATHTLVTYPIVSKMGISKDISVAVTVGATILTDTAVLILLAIILGSHEGGLTQEFWLSLAISVLLFSAFMFLVIPKISQWFFRKFSSEKHSHYIFVLAVVFLAAFLAEIAGLEAIIGAFFAGLAINKLIPASSTLMNRIEFIGNSLFIPFFLISVGMIVDVSVILSGWMALVIAGTLTIVALFGKWFAAFIAQKVFKFSKPQRNIIFGLSGSHAAATLAVIMVGHEAGIIDDNILNGTIILILITCIVSSFATEKAAKDLVLEADDEEDPKDADAEIHNEFILIPIANVNSRNIEKMLDFGVFIKDRDSVNPLSVLTVVPNNKEAERKILKTRKGLSKFVEETSASDTAIEIKATIDQNPASGIARRAREAMADMILLGWPRKTGLLDRLIGDKMDSIISLTSRTLFICDFRNPLIEHKRLFMVVPPSAEFEEGFDIWVAKIAQLSVELSIPIVLNSTEETHTAILEFAKQKKLTLTINFNKFDDWEEFFIVSREMKEKDFLITILARKSYVSHNPYLDRIPDKLEQHLADQSKIIIYPE